MYKSNTRIVTCVYYSHKDSEMGGRSWPEDYYRWTLCNIFNFGLPVTIFCYDDEEVKAKIQKIIDTSKNNINGDINVEILTHDLKTHPNYSQIIENRRLELERENSNKERNPYGFNWVRNETICHTKLTFLKKVFEHYSDVENVVWIDAGITHWGLNPRCYGGMEINGLSHTYEEFYPFRATNMFNPTIGKGFEEIFKTHKLFLVGHNNNWYSTQLQLLHGKFVYDNPDYKNMFDANTTWVKNNDDQVLRIYDDNTSPHEFIHHYAANTDPNYNGRPISIFGKQIIGGIIGVNRDEINDIIHFYDRYLNYILQSGHRSLFTEEPILSLYYCLFRPKLFSFTDWNHNVPHDPPNPCTTAGEYVKSFYNVWKEFASASTSDSQVTPQ